MPHGQNFKFSKCCSLLAHGHGHNFKFNKCCTLLAPKAIVLTFDLEILLMEQASGGQKLETNPKSVIFLYYCSLSIVMYTSKWINEVKQKEKVTDFRMKIVERILFRYLRLASIMLERFDLLLWLLLFSFFPSKN